MSLERFHVAVELAEAIADYLDSIGLSGTEFFQQQGVDPEADFENGYLGFDRFCSLFDAAAVYANDDYIGLRAGNNFVVRHWGRLGYLIMAGENGLEGIRFIQRFARTVTDALQLNWSTQEDTLTCEFVVGSPTGASPVSRQVIDYLVSSSYSLSQASSSDVVSYLAVYFAHDGGPQPQWYESLLNTRCYFSQSSNRIVADLAMLKKASAHRDPRLKKILENHAQQVLQSLPTVDELVNEVQTYVLSQLSNGVPTLKQVSEHFGQNERTFQRNLAKQGVHFQDMVDDLRHRLALEYIHNDYSFLDIAMMLGYSEQSAFHRAFKRWTGMPPSKYRHSRE